MNLRVLENPTRDDPHRTPRHVTMLDADLMEEILEELTLRRNTLLRAVQIAVACASISAGKLLLDFAAALARFMGW